MAQTAPLTQRIEAWSTRLYRIPPERLAREEPLRAELLRPLLAAAWIALAINAISLFPQTSGFWFFWTALDPLILVAIASWAAARKHIHTATVMLLVGLAHSAVFTHAHYGLPHLTGTLLSITILVCGLLIGEYFLRAWTFLCCAMILWIGYTSAAKPDWFLAAEWCVLYCVTGWLVTLFSRHLERLLDAARIAEENRRGAVIAERTRFAREIHDTLAQGFTGILMQINAAGQRLETDPNAARAHLDKALQLARESLQEARRSAHALKPGPLETGDLLTAIRQAGDQLTSGTGVAFEAACDGTPYPLPDERASHLFRVAQEGLTNAVRHSAATRIAIRLHYSPSHVAVEVRDNGKGIIAASPAGLGLENMQERVQQLGGEFRVESHPGRGTCITASVPGS